MRIFPMSISMRLMQCAAYDVYKMWSYLSVNNSLAALHWPIISDHLHVILLAHMIYYLHQF